MYMYIHKYMYICIYLGVRAGGIHAERSTSDRPAGDVSALRLEDTYIYIKKSMHVYICISLSLSIYIYICVYTS